MIKNKKTLSIIGLIFLTSATAFAILPICIDVANIPFKNPGDVITATEFNTIVRTLEGLYNTNGSIGIGKEPVSDVPLDVNGGMKVGFQDSPCTEILAGTTRYNDLNSDLEFCNGIEWVSSRNNNKNSTGTCETIENPVINIDGYNYSLDGYEANVLGFCRDNGYSFGMLLDSGDFISSDESTSKHCAYWNGLKWITHAGCHTAYKIECCDTGNTFLSTCLDNEILSFDEISNDWKCVSMEYQIVGGGYRYEGDYSIGKTDICNTWGDATCNHDKNTHQLIPPFCPAESTEMETSHENSQMDSTSNIISVHWQCIKGNIEINYQEYYD